MVITGQIRTEGCMTRSAHPANTFSHFRERMLERYGLDVTPEQVAQVEAEIRDRVHHRRAYDTARVSGLDDGPARARDLRQRARHCAAA